MDNKREVNWGPAIFLISYQIILLLSLPFYFYFFTPSWGLIIVSIVLLYMAGMSITGGYHRLYSHKAYRVHPIVETFVLFFGAMAAQGSALRWSFDHRIHHAYVDTDEDPYSINKGFLYAHFLWILDKPRTIDPKVVPDLLKNPLVQFQHRHIGKLMIFTNVIAFFVVGFLLNDYVGAFFLAVWGRMFALHHFTWFINSLAHTWGDKPFSQEQTAVDNYFLSMLTFGEGYHNYHHTFANDYRNGVKWFHFDPTKWAIWLLSIVGLAKDLKRMNSYAIKKRMVIEHKTLLLNQIHSYWNATATELEKQINELSERLVANITVVSQLRDKYKQIKREKHPTAILASLKAEMRSIRKNLHDDWKQWKLLSMQILDQKVFPLTAPEK